MSNARAPKRKEEYTSPSDIEVICGDILEKGRVLENVIGKKFPDAEDARDAMEQLLGVVKQYKLVGKWVSSSATIKEIRDVSSFVYFIFLSFVISMSKCRFSQITLAAVIECMQKSYKCYEMNPYVWGDVNEKG